MRPEFLCIAAAQNRPALVDIHDVHGAVADVAEHICSSELPQTPGDGGKALREDIHSGKLHMVVRAPEGKIYAVILQEVCTESVLLFTDPCEGQPRRNMHAGGGDMADAQLPPDGGES